ncbi:MAG: hypothetical protein ACK5LJ_08825 [Paracoccus sp. (in: a-proteobacteria)]
MGRFSAQGSGAHWAVFDGGTPVKTFCKPWRAWDHADKLERQARRKRRACLSCGTQFTSEGPHHRMCGRCRRDASETFEGAV